MYEVNLTESYFPAQKDIILEDNTIGQLLLEASKKYDSKEALVEITQSGIVGRTWTYEELYSESLQLAKALASRFNKGDHIVIWSPNSPEWVLMEFAAGLAGLVVVTANPALQEKELRYILEHSNAVGLFLTSEFRGNPMLEIGTQACKGNQEVREIINMENRTDLFENTRGNQNLPEVCPNDPAQIQYTSGTTGFPKGAVLSHIGLTSNAKFYADRCQVKESYSWVNIMPMFHTSGCGMVTLGCLNSKCRMILVSLFEPENVLFLIEKFKAEIILCVPTTALAILEEQETNPKNVDSLRVLSCGGANVAPEMVRRIREKVGCQFSTLFGQTEYCPVITQHHLTDGIDDICSTIGQPVSHADVSIKSVSSREILPLQEVGEICVRGPSTMLAYYGNPEATLEAIDSERWLHTGDLGIMDSRGYLTITGRVKEMIIRGGENHYPAEIENVLREHHDISDVAVVGIPDDKWGEVIGCFIRFINKPINTSNLKKFCRENISPQKTPTIWVNIDNFPLTGSGKIQKFKLREDFCSGHLKQME